MTSFKEYVTSAVARAKANNPGNLFQCKIKNFASGKTVIVTLRRVFEDDVDWRFPDDNSEFNEKDWQVIESVHIQEEKTDVEVLSEACLVMLQALERIKDNGGPNAGAGFTMQQCAREALNKVKAIAPKEQG